MTGRPADAAQSTHALRWILARLETMPASIRKNTLHPAITAAHPEELSGLLPAALGDGDIDLQTLALVRMAELSAEARSLLPPPGNASALRGALDSAMLSGRDAGEIFALILELVEREDWCAGLDAVLDGLVSTNHALVEALDDPLGPLRQHAGELFPRLLANAVDAREDPDTFDTPDAHDRPSRSATLDQVLARAARLVRTHRNDDVLLAIALQLPRAGPALAAVVADPESDLHGAIRAVPERTGDQRVRRSLVRWLGVPALGRAVSRWLYRIEDAPGFEDLLHDGHLLRAPRRRHPLRLADRALRVVPDPELVAALPTGAALAAVRLVVGLDLTPGTRDDRLAGLIELPQSLVRLRVVEHLAQGNKRRNGAALRRAASDSVSVVARCAGFALGDNAGDAALRRNSSHSGVARRARRELALESPEQLGRMLGDLCRREQAAVARRLTHRDPAGVAAALIAVAGSGSAERMVRQDALGLIQRLKLAGEVSSELADLAESADPFVAATALHALAGTGAVAESAATAQLDVDRPARVRANAIELLARQAPLRHCERLSLLAREESNRGRANAAVGLSRIDPVRGGAAILALMSDSDPLYRISGIWAARASTLTELLPAVQVIERSDPVPMIQVRAAAARRLLSSRSRVPVDATRTTALARDLPVGEASLSRQAEDARRAGRHVLKSYSRENSL